MHRFLLLIRRYWNFIFFLILEVFCVYLIAKSRSTQGLTLISSSNSVVSYCYRKEQNISGYFHLRQVNDQLLEENKALLSRLFEQASVDSYKSILASIPVMDYDRSADSSKPAVSGMIFQAREPVHVIRWAKYDFIPVRVINNSISNARINFITLNRGANSGIKAGMAVVGPKGIVGRVEHVSEHFATVASVLSYRKVSARLERQSSFGSITWKPGNPDFVQMANMPLSLPIHINDSVFTTGYSYFPANVLIGTVSRIDTIKENNSQLLQIRLATDFRTLRYVYVVRNEMKKEQTNLEKRDHSTR